ncbi:unnamed protein product [Periconia digitata]|uniref:Uncharacterized protein n=1 Tax=Periconia digitata TaxID=1303443 RepID=A0A9W4XRS6_9PLEO|nr:unnamed protein product [Periconia digitata]
MTSSIRLYERLDLIPQDPKDPESLDDLIVCAFGAFERYYVCWRNKAGEYRQGRSTLMYTKCRMINQFVDGYDLPPALQEWLWPQDNTTRDFASLQVVFGRGDEYFASDKNGKLEYKEPEKKSPETTEDKPGLRRTRTMSLFRAAPDTTTKPSAATVDDASPDRRSSATSQSESRPPSMSFSTRSMSDSSFISHPSSRSPSISSMASTVETLATIPSRPTSDADLKPLEPKSFVSAEDPLAATTALRLKRRSRPLSMSFKPSTTPRIAEGRTLSSETAATSLTPETFLQANLPVTSAHCTCGCHANPQPVVSRPTPPSYANASVQTSPIPSPMHTVASTIQPYSNYASATQDTDEIEENYYDAPVANPFPMGSMMAFFSKPGYQLGDSLRRSYEDEYDDSQYEYDDGYERTYVRSYDNDWAAWEAANGRF